LPERQIVSVQEMGWSGIKNGELLKLVVDEFDVFITSDKNLRHQQNFTTLTISIIILPSNQVPVVKAMLSSIDEALSTITQQQFVEL